MFEEASMDGKDTTQIAKKQPLSKLINHDNKSTTANMLSLHE